MRVGVQRGVAEGRDALARGDAVLELPVRQLLAHHPVGLVEPPHLPRGAVGDEVHRVLAVAHRQADGVVPAGADGVERDQLRARIGLELPARVETAVVVQLPDVVGPDVRRVRDRDAPDAGVARAGERGGAERQLLDVPVVDPDAFPGRRELRLAALDRAHAAHADLEPPAHHLRPEGELVRRAAHRVVGQREQHAIVQHQAVPLGPGRSQRRVGFRPVARRQERAHLVAPEPPGHGQRVGIDHGDRQVGPAHLELEVEHLPERIGGQVERPVPDEDLRGADRDPAVPDRDAVVARHDPDVLAARLEARLHRSARRGGVADFGQLEKRRERNQRHLAVPVRGHGAVDQAAQRQVHQDRLGLRGVGRRGSGAGRRCDGGGWLRRGGRLLRRGRLLRGRRRRGGG